MVKDINLVVSLSDQIFQFTQFSVVAKVTAVMVSVHGGRPKEWKNEMRKANGALSFHISNSQRASKYLTI